MPDIHLAQYIVERLKQAGVKWVFGVPGDYNLEFLDYFEQDDHLEWVGNANELNAAYAADGYARVKSGLAVVVTTFGVGELSALNGIAGCLAERIPVLHIVGAPSTKQQANQTLLHHTLNTPGTFTAFSKMSEPLSCAQALLTRLPDSEKAKAFDGALTACLRQCRPAYVELPMDAVRCMVSDEGLKKELPRPYSAPVYESTRSEDESGAPMNDLNPVSTTDDHFDVSSEDVTAHVVDLIAKRYAAASRPAILVDACTARFGMGTTVRELAEKCRIRGFTTPMGKGILDERNPLFGGCYAGSNSLPAVQEELESSDFVLYVGALKSDFNSGSFTVNIPTENAIRLHSYTTNVGYASFPTTDIRHVLPKLLPAFQAVKRSANGVEDTLDHKVEKGVVLPLTDRVEGDQIVHKWLWRRVGTWLKDGDIIVTETGTSNFGFLPISFPSRVTYVSQVLWGSIGWSVGAVLGCALAATEQGGRRTILFVGDGSLQLTVQEIGTIVRRGIPAYIFVLNNDGYEIERRIHGQNAKYNDIQRYDHQQLLPFLGGKPEDAGIKYQSHRVATQEELHKLLEDPEFAVNDRVRLIELVMPRDDAPDALIKQAQLTAESNAA